MGILWQPAPKPKDVQALYDQAEDARKAQPDRFKLTLDAVLRKAKKRSGLNNWGSDDFIPRLQVLVDSITDEARLNALGRQAAGLGMTTDMVNGRLELEEMRQAFPEIFERDIGQPVFIVGASRTGTTLIQRLLSADPANRSPLLWEMGATAVIGKNDVEAMERAHNRTSAGQGMLHFLNPAMKAVHYSHAGTPDECVLMMGTDLRNWALMACMNIPAYCDRLLKEDFTESYLRHKQQLQLLTNPDDKKRWILKAPYHLPVLQALMAVYRGAKIIHTHRDVVDTVTSTASLYSVFRSTFSDNVDPRAVGKQQLNILHEWFQRLIRARDIQKKNSSMFFDVYYPELVKDPLAVMKQIYTAFDMDWTEAGEQAMRQWLKENRQSKHGRHRYAPEQFGLDPEEIREQLKFYSDFFNIG